MQATRTGQQQAAYPSPTGANTPRTLAKRCHFGRHLSSSIPPQEHHPWVTLTPPWRTTQNTDRQDAHRQPRGVCNTSFNEQTPSPGWSQGRTRTTKEARSLAKGREILIGAFNGILGNPPLLPTAIQPLPTLRDVLSMKYLTIDPLVNAFLSIAMQNRLILPVA